MEPATRMPNPMITYKIEEMQDIVKDILIALRGRFSARQFSTKLGRSPNIYSRWESGAVEILWEDFVDILSFRKIPLDEKLRHWYALDSGALEIGPLCRRITQNRKKEEISQFVPISSARIQSFLDGTGRLRLVDFLLLFFTFTSFAIDFLFDLLRDYPPKCLSERYEKIASSIEMTRKHPYVGPIISLANEGQNGWDFDQLADIVAREVALPRAEVSSVMQEMLRIGVLTPADDGKTLKSHGLSFDMRIEPSLSWTSRKYWLDRFSRFLNANSGDAGENTFANIVTVMNDETARKAREEIRACYERIIRLLEEAQGPEGKVIVLQFLIMFPRSFRKG